MGQGTYNSSVGNLTLGGLSVPVNRDLISSICNILIPPLRVSQPSTQVFLERNQPAIIAVYAVTHTRLVGLAFGLGVGGVHLRVLFHIKEVIETERMF